MQQLLIKLNLLLIPLLVVGCQMAPATSNKVDSTLRHPEPMKDYWESTGAVHSSGDINWLFLAWWVPLIIIGVFIVIGMFRRAEGNKP
jgi:hypothetical protein